MQKLLPAFKRFLCLLFTFLLCLPAVGFCDVSTAFQERLAQLRTPAQEDETSGFLLLRTGDSVFLPCLNRGVIPYDEADSSPVIQLSGTAQSSDSSIAALDEKQMLHAVSEGSCIITYADENGTREYQVTVSGSAMPMQIRNYLFVLNREYLTLQKTRLEKANQYTKWYYQKKKGVGWCSVFTIYCANASGNAVWRYKQSNATKRFPALDYENVPEVCFMAEGEVGHQYDAFLKMGRFGSVPKPGYLVIYADLSNAYRTTHIASVVNVEDRGNGVYAVRTIEGNMSNTIKCYEYLYDSKVDNHLVGSDKTNKKQKLQSNMAELPASEQTDELVQYPLHTDHWAVFGFCETW